MRYERLGVAIVFVLIGCGGAAPAPLSSAKTARDDARAISAPGLPDQRPQDFRISLSMEGPKLANITCDTTECVLTQLSKTDTTTTHKPVTAEQLDALYKVVHDQTFDKIKVEAGAPQEGSAVAILWVRSSGTYYGVMPHEKEEVAKADASKFDAVRSALEQLSTELHIGPDTPMPPPPGVSAPGGKVPAAHPAKPGAPTAPAPGATPAAPPATSAPTPAPTN